LILLAMTSWFGARSKPNPVQRTADSLANELVKQARQAGDRAEVVADLLTRWVEQSDRGGDAFLLGDAVGRGAYGGSEELALSFRDVLLRSHAFEALLETCSRAPALVAMFQRDACPEDQTLIRQAMSAVAERLLLPGSLSMWPSLLEALVAGGGGGGASSDGEYCPKKMNMRWEPWARKVLAAVTRTWESEALPGLVRQLERRLAETSRRQPLSGRALGGEGGAAVITSSSSDLLRAQSLGGIGMSKRGIRAALAREQLQQFSAEAAVQRARVKLQCSVCELVRAAESSGVTRLPRLERLLVDAQEALASLDARAAKHSLEQDGLSKSVDEIGGELQKQITGVLMTRESFEEKRKSFQEERAALVWRLEEVDAQIVQLDKASSECTGQLQQLQEQLRGTTAHYEEMIAASVRTQKGLSDEKLRAVVYAECAHTAVDVVSCDARRSVAQLAALLRRHSSELQRSLAAYLQRERQRLGAAAEWLEASRTAGTASGAGTAGVSAGSGDGDTGVREAMAAAQDAWQGARRLLRRADHVLGREYGGVAVSGTEVEDGAEGEAPVAIVAQSPEGCSCAESSPIESAHEFFTNGVPRARRSCVECSAADATWASVSHGTYLCTDCAGLHRGLGVHLSFVRSTEMDRWTPQQLRRMQLGGNERFQEFLRGFPRLCDGSAAATTLSSPQVVLAARYGSRAVAFYRRQLDAACEGRDLGKADGPPAPDEGHLVAEDNLTGTAGLGQGDGSSGGSAAAKRSDDDDAAAAAALLEGERTAFEAAYLEYQCRLEVAALASTGAGTAAGGP